MTEKPKRKNAEIEIVNARVHNLKNISLSIPKNKLIVVTGLSGSGKSSLTMDTLYAEGQRRYVESLSSYARQFLVRMNKPEVDYIKGLCPAIAIEQRVVSKSTRSTVGSLTEMYDYLRLLFARIGKTYSPISNNEVKKHNISDVIQYINAQPHNCRIFILIQLKINNSEKIERLNILLKKGFSRILKNNEILDIEDVLQQNIQLDEIIYLLIDRLKPSMLIDDENFINRLNDSIQTAFNEGKGELIIQTIQENNSVERQMFNNKFELDGMLFETPSPHLFNFNNSYGACKRCEGFGSVIGIDEEKVIPNNKLSIFEGAIACWKGEQMSEFQKRLMSNAEKFDFPIHRPIKELDKKQRKLLWQGNKYFVGINDFFKELEEQSYKIQYRVMLARYRGKTLCPECEGSRIRKDALYVKINEKHIGEILKMSIDDLKSFFTQLKLNPNDTKIASRLLLELNNRLQFMQDVGLGYLSLNRTAESLSGGETQRISLTRTLGSNLTESLYLLDEPSIGLHPRDTSRLIKVLNNLKNLGNTVVVVEHEEAIIRAADHIVDIGPAAGAKGGYVVFNGSFDLLSKQKTLTANYINGIQKVEIPKIRRKSGNKIIIQGANENNLKNINVKIPLNQIVVITGVSGSGKTTLIKKVLYPALKKHFDEPTENLGKFDAIHGDLKQISQVEMVNQSPIGKSSRSNPVTYVKAYDAIRELYAKQAMSKIRDFKPAHFSFNVDGGRCDNCQGEGETIVEMQFMADIHLPCEVCNGQRFKKDVLEVTFQEKNIADVLQMTVDEALIFFVNQKDIIQKLQPLQDVGLGYIKLGQSSSTLSGGEAQRVKLATFLSKGKTNNPLLFIFDEPTTGLHFHDVHTLMKCFNALIENGHSIIIIEHNLDVIKCADYIIDLGPEGGENGGFIIAEGTPEMLAKVKESYTGQYLKKILN